jgi:hypothetical protein
LPRLEGSRQDLVRNPSISVKNAEAIGSMARRLPNFLHCVYGFRWK